MAGFRISDFRGIRPRRAALKLPEGEAQTSINTKLGSGDLEPFVDVDTGIAVENPISNNTIYLFDNNDDPRWFQWNNFVTVARGSVKGDILERTYYTGDGLPKMTYIGIAEGGAGPYPESFRFLGMPAPVDAMTASGRELPESVPSADRRSVFNTMTTKKMEVVFVNYTVYPGTGTPDQVWNISAGLGSVTFNLQPGDTARVTGVVDDDHVLLGSATNTGAFAETAVNDKTSGAYWNAMDNNGSTREADFVGWRIPDGVNVTIIGHKLRVGDVIRITRLDFSDGLKWMYGPTDDFFERGWIAEVEVTQDGSTFYQTANAIVAASADETTDFPIIDGGFFYDVDRSASDASELEDRTYVYTYVSALGEESPPSPPSAIVNALDGDVIQLSGMTPPLTVGYEITHIRIYRTNSTAAGTEFQFVKEMAVATDTTDEVKSQNLGEILATATWEPPPSGLQGITSMPNGMMVGFAGKNIHMCEPYFPHAWPPEYDQAIDYNIIAMEALGNSVVVLTEGVPYILTGSHPRNVNIRPYKINQACVSVRSVASDADRVLYASPDGLVEISINGVKVVTDQYVKKKEWAAFVPTTIVGEIHDGKYFGFFDAAVNLPSPPTSASLAGTIVSVDTDEEDIQAGGRTMVITLSGETFVASGATFNATRQDIIDGIESSDDFITGWPTAMTQNIPVGDVTRSNNTTVTILLTARPEYSIIADETMQITVPASALTAGVDLLAPETFNVTAILDHSTGVIGFTDFDATSDRPYAINSSFDINDWDSYEGVGTPALEQVDITAATHSLAQDRWVATGFRDTGATDLPDTMMVATSDDTGATWTVRTHQLTANTDKKPRTAIHYDDHATFAIAGDNTSLQVSADGETWLLAPVDPTVPATESLRDLVIANSTIEHYLYAGCLTSDFLIRSPNLATTPAEYQWAASVVAYSTATGTKHMGSGATNIISVGNYDTDMELAVTAHGALTSTVVGVISGFNCTGMIFGDDIWVAISNDFRITTCTSGNEDTIAQWTTPTTTKAANVTIHGIRYDQGDGIRTAYGFVAYGVNTSTSKGVIYTSPDAVTWTLRHTQTESVPIKALAVRYPEDQLGEAFIDFAPTYNGAQSPTLVGDTEANYTGTGGQEPYADAKTLLRMSRSLTDATIVVQGTEVGDYTDNGSYNVSPTTIFTLNTQPDQVRITLTQFDTDTGEGSDPGTAVVSKLGSFNNGVFGAPPINFGFGYEIETEALTEIGKGADTWGEGIAIVTFTFRKTGYNDLSVAYRIRADSNATFV